MRLLRLQDLEKTVKYIMTNLIFEEKNGILIIKPENYICQLKDCAICGFALRHRDDLIEHNRFGCCVDCSLFFRQPNKEKWTHGWRPSRKEVSSVIFKNIGE